ncbi:MULTISPECIES: hypothetical protein [Nostoc]|uniref:Uncharacterized protein n=1 Tax=Nostoc paludosum FACHB-159 TaxID=2692908 RepID=A0ABR8KP94_9NOSO|nr:MULTISPECIES: hypothetical protein [Nostoc]MBD2683230.1 hypothetical protein [Nostoc sp. FACHB-857]MBD2739557.1 hypothetical protein [Nostoc paludosum FACHB-159]
MTIQNQYETLEASLIELRTSLSQSDPDYQIVATALKELRRSQVAYNLTKHSDAHMTTDSKLHPMTKGLRWNQE